MITVELSEILSAKNMSYKELARLSGVPESYVLKLVAGIIVDLNLEYADAICRALEVSPWTWLTYMDDWIWKDEDGNQTNSGGTRNF